MLLFRINKTDYFLKEKIITVYVTMQQLLLQNNFSNPTVCVLRDIDFGGN